MDLPLLVYPLNLLEPNTEALEVQVCSEKYNHRASFRTVLWRSNATARKCSDHWGLPNIVYRLNHWDCTYNDCTYVLYPKPQICEAQGRPSPLNTLLRTKDDCQEKKPRPQQARQRPREESEVRFTSSGFVKFCNAVCSLRWLEVFKQSPTHYFVQLIIPYRCVSTAKAIPKDKAIKRFLVR